MKFSLLFLMACGLKAATFYDDNIFLLKDCAHLIERKRSPLDAEFSLGYDPLKKGFFDSFRFGNERFLCKSAWIKRFSEKTETSALKRKRFVALMCLKWRDDATICLHRVIVA